MGVRGFGGLASIFLFSQVVKEPKYPCRLQSCYCAEVKMKQCSGVKIKMSEGTVAFQSQKYSKSCLSESEIIY